jgi:hypothetical protein
MEISFTPDQPQAPVEVLVDGSIYPSGWLAGIEAYQFDVAFEGAPVEIRERDPFDGSKIAFTAEQPGAYRVSLFGSIGDEECVDGLVVVNVLDPAAQVDTYRLRFVPAAGQPAPIQEQAIAIPGGVSSYSLGAIGLANGVVAHGTVVDGGGAPLAGYLRLVATGGGEQVIEAFADAAGGFTTRVAGASYQALVVPADPAIAPARFDGLAAGVAVELAVSAGDPISGLVVDGGGAPLAGARVSLRIDGVPSTLAVTDAEGAFTVRARAGGATAVTVSPPPGSGLPRLDLPAGAGLVAAVGVPLTIRYAAGLTARDLALEVRLADGVSPAADARVTWIARPLAEVGTVTASGGDALAAGGGLRWTTVADGGGALAASGLPETLYDVVVETGAVGLLEVDLAAGVASPAALVAPSAARLVGQLTAGEGDPVAAAQVVATARGVLANVPGAVATAASDAFGAFALDLVGGGGYDLSLVPADAQLARVRLVGVTAPAAGSVGDLGLTELPPAISVFGQVTIPGVAGGAAGVTVMALCWDCEGVAAQAPVAEALTDGAGRFTLAIPDPGSGAR